MTLKTLAVALLVSIIAVAGAFAATEEDFRNMTGGDVLGIRIEFTRPVNITNHDDVFPDVDPSGRSTEFTFSGGTLRNHQAFTVSWDASAMVTDWEWVTHDADDGDSPGYDCSTTVGPDSWVTLESVLDRSWDGMVVCLEPGEYEIPDIIVEHDVTLIGLGDDPSEVVVSYWGYDSVSLIANECTLILENLSLAGAVCFRNLGGGHCIAREVHTTTGCKYIENFCSAAVTGGGTLEMYSCAVGGYVHASAAGHVILVSSTFAGYGFWGLDIRGVAVAELTHVSFSNRTYGCNLDDRARLVMNDCTFDSSVEEAISLSWTNTDAKIEGGGNHIPPELLDGLTYNLPEGFLADD